MNLFRWYKRNAEGEGVGLHPPLATVNISTSGKAYYLLKKIQ